MRYVLLLALLTSACDPGGQLLAISLRTDLVAIEEIDEVVVSIDGVERARGRIDASLALQDGAAIAEVSDIDASAHTVEVQLFLEGDLVIERLSLVQVDGPTAITVVVTRDCRGVDCGAGETGLVCLQARCVAPTCSPEKPEDCPAPECAVDADCATGSACSAAACVDGVCLYGDAGSCGERRRCDASTGCVGLRIESIEPIQVVYSLTEDRADPLPLQDAEVSGSVFVHVIDQPHLSQVAYRLDQILDTSLHETLDAPPWDLSGNGSLERAEPFNFGFIREGTHVLRVVATLDDGSSEDLSIPFTTRNGLDGFFFSLSPWRTSPMPLADASLRGDVYVTWAPFRRRDVEMVIFHLDDPMMTNPLPFQEEEIHPYDLAGGLLMSPFSNATRFAIEGLVVGPHELTAQVVYSTAQPDELVTVGFETLPMAAP